MVLQSIVYPNTICSHSQIYYRGVNLLLKDAQTAIVPANSKVSFYSYMNCFDIEVWKKYTQVKNVWLKIGLQGKGRIYIKSKYLDKEINILELEFNENDSIKNNEIEIDITKYSGICYFDIESVTDVNICNARFETDKSFVNQEVHLALNMCTYHRKDDIERNINQIKSSEFFRDKSDLYDKLSIIVVDNGSELEVKEESNYKLVHNINNGGSGGFKRGLQELRKYEKHITHVVFMDDDVEFINESLYRLYALLSYMKKEYINESVAGRMFRLDERHIQYTAAEIWNKGDIRHIGLNQDMTKEEDLLLVNNNNGAQYGGWWFCCYPMSFARDNDPLPFFIHCDDVEYGLRYGGTPIVLNGVQVWHETYEYRQNLMISYYDTRNSMVVNAMYSNDDMDDVLQKWKGIITSMHIKQNYIGEYITIKAMHDFLKGMPWLNKNGNKKVKVPNINRQWIIKYANKIYWRYCQKIFYKKYLLIKNTLREDMKR